MGIDHEDHLDLPLQWMHPPECLPQSMHPLQWKHHSPVDVHPPDALPVDAPLVYAPPPLPEDRRSTGGRYASYWNTFLCFM